jgi:methylenetetrahydrofolate dehydrogenase (NADP+)/methenyltetrahydrofolate cyclohydrolase
LGLIEGRQIAEILRGATAVDVAGLREKGVAPTLGIVVPTDDKSTASYVDSLVRVAETIGIDIRRTDLVEPSGEEVAAVVGELSTNPDVHGVLCQSPLPPGVLLGDIGAQIHPSKDVDGANPTSLGRLAAGLPAFAPATAQAVIEILRHEQVGLRAADAVVVGRSNIVGKPVALLLVAEDATVTVCHSQTEDLAGQARRADVLVVAVGRPKLIGAEHVKRGAIVVDVGINVTGEGDIVGDVDTAAVEQIARITPVPGGVGPVTTSVLLRNIAGAAGAKRLEEVT